MKRRFFVQGLCLYEIVRTSGSKYYVHCFIGDQYVDTMVLSKEQAFDYVHRYEAQEVSEAKFDFFANLYERYPT